MIVSLLNASLHPRICLSVSLKVYRNTQKTSTFFEIRIRYPVDIRTFKFASGTGYEF